ncbi:MAG: UvrD-helicase domain-containing protein [Candidatus Paceibacterota bacterium]|nr:MAG: UvrD-helicase domain-containing protein [Candidatus Paceibacterota bacterium]
MKNISEKLNPKQKEAVETIDGPVLIVAGAGAGKTKTLTWRILHLIKSGVDPEKILAITFTNKAAREMRDRVFELLKQGGVEIHNGKGPFLGTFHALGVKIIKENSKIFGLNRYFKIFDREDSKKAIKESLKNLGKKSDLSPGAILSLISKQKGELKTPEDFEEFSFEDSGFSYLPKEVVHVWREYEKILKRERALDFDDLLLKCEFLLRKDEILKKYHDLWHYIHIDEYQDTNKAQYEIAKRLAKDKRNICVVGDHDQCVYSFRGARFKNLIDFEKDYPEAKMIFLEENYRSSQNILNAANEVIKKNTLRPEKNLFTRNEIGDKLSLIEAENEIDEAAKIATLVKDLIQGGVSAKEIAVLYRANFQSRALEEVFMGEGLPYQVIGIKFFERKEIKDIVSYLRAALDWESFSDIKRIINVPPRGLGKTSLLKIFAGKESELNIGIKIKIKKFRDFLLEIKKESETKYPSELIRFVLEKSGLKNHLEKGGVEDIERLENILELVNFAGRYSYGNPSESLSKFLDDVSLATDEDSPEKPQENLKLMTAHAAKGLEFDYVFISGLEENLFPYERPNMRAEEKEEERRLFYVALTRARKKVFLSYAGRRGIFGNNVYNLPSSFIADIPGELIEFYNRSSNFINIEF